ncbi:hypothetical protein C8R45DRAFT_1216293 [Mycena sanguinolenta]|nr:hypothetical protein C8R45DRAFT_1216293 [Mycena sanguinolenta]
MAPKPWATPDQTAVLEAWLPTFIQRQAETKQPLFWPAMHEAWFKQFPEQASLNLPLPTDKNKRKLTPEEDAKLSKALDKRMGQLENWFRNRSRKIGNANGNAAASTNNAVIQKIFRLSVPKKQRVHQTIELFQIRNQQLVNDALKAAGYDLLNASKDPDDVDDWADEADDTPAARTKRKKSERMQVRTRVVRDLFSLASEEEREAIKEEIEVERKKLQEEELAAAQQEELKSKMPVELQRAIDALDGVFADIHRGAHSASGWVGMTLIGGPNPRMNGDLTLKVVCFGQTPAGNDFEACCVEFDKNIIQPFQDFLRICFNGEDTAALALPTTTAIDDDTPVHRVAVLDSVEEPENAKTSKRKKSKKSKASKKKIVPNTTAEDSVLSASPVPVPDENENMAMDESDEYIVPMFPSSRCMSPAPNEVYGGDLQADDFEMADIRTDNPGTPAAASIWPVGMTPPLRPDEAETLAMMERGGTTNPATMAIDPQLLDPAIVSTPFTPMPPKPRPVYKGSAPTPSTNMFGLPRDLYRPSNLFEAFRTSTLVSRSPSTSSVASAPSVSVSPLASKSATSASQPTRPSRAAQLLTSIVNSPAPSTSPLVPAALAVNAPPPAAATAPSPQRFILTTPVPPPLSCLPVLPLLPLPCLPVLPSLSLPAVTTLIPPSPVATTATLPLTSATTLPSSLPADTLPAQPAPGAALSWELPGSRPQAKPLPALRGPAPAKTAKKKQVPSRKSSTAGIIQKQVAAAAAGDQAAKKRGRPLKQVLVDITNEVISSDVPPSSPADAATTTTLPATASTNPVYIVSSTNNNRAAARQAAEREKAAAEKAAVDAAAAQAAKGWTETTVDGATVVTFTSTRVRRAAKHPDGSDVGLEKKKTRPPNTKKTDASLTKLLERGTKRKADEASGPKRKKRRA